MAHSNGVNIYKVNKMIKLLYLCICVYDKSSVNAQKDEHQFFKAFVEIDHHGAQSVFTNASVINLTVCCNLVQ